MWFIQHFVFQNFQVITPWHDSLLKKTSWSFLHIHIELFSNTTYDRNKVTSQKWNLSMPLNTRQPNTAWYLYNAINFLKKSSQQTPHSSPVRARYGVYVVILSSDSILPLLSQCPIVINWTGLKRHLDVYCWRRDRDTSSLKLLAYTHFTGMLNQMFWFLALSINPI